MNQKIEIILMKMIRRLYLFKNMSDEETLELAKNFKLNFYKKGSIIFKENTYLTNIYILKNGQLDIIKSTGNNSISLGHLKEGELFGEMSYLNNVATMAMVYASTDCDIWEIPINKFGKFLEKHPHIKSEIIQIKEARESDNKSKLKFNNNSVDNTKDNCLEDITLFF
ncbi:MAG: cyclic nucleotide-binding domain-containing protein [Candidatus Absconditabacteria bacterium]